MPRGGNLDGIFHTYQPILWHTIARAALGDSFGRSVASLDMASLVGTAHNERDVAAKAASNLLVQALAAGHARYGLTANATCRAGSMPKCIYSNYRARLTSILLGAMAIFPARVHLNPCLVEIFP